MRRLRIGAVVLAVLLLLSGAVSWLFYTTSGVDLLLSSISRLTPAKIGAADVRGHLAREVFITGLSIHLPETTISAGKVRLSCSLWRLFSGRFAVDFLTGEDVEVMRTGPQKKERISFIPPHISRFVAALEGRIKAFTIDNLRYLSSSEEPIVINRISGRAEWYRGALSMQCLRVGLPAGDISGRLDIGFYRPSLKSDLWIESREDRASLNKLLIRANLNSTFGTAAMAGGVKVWAYEGNEGRVALEASLAASQYTLDIRNVTLSRPGLEGRITGYGQIKTEKVLPSFSGHVNMEQFRLQELMPVNATVTGKANIDGNSEAYGGRFTISNAAQGGLAFKGNGTFRGDRRQVTAQVPSGGWLGGSLTGDVTIVWDKTVKMTGHVSARGLNTALIDETWQGIIHGDASFFLYGSASGSGISTAGLNVRLLESTFRGRPVKGAVAASYDKGILRLTELALTGRGFDLTAQGILAQRINFLANIQDLSSLVPGAKGALTGQGWLRYGKTDLAMKLSGTGKVVQYGPMRVGRVDVSAAVNDTGTKGLNVEITGQAITCGGVDFSTLKSAVKGKVSDHEAYVKATGPVERMAATLTGGYNKGAWKGSVKELKGSDKERGDWSLRGPVGLILSVKRIFLEPFTLYGSKGESIVAAIDLQLKPFHGFIKAEWQNLDLSRLSPVMPVSLNMRARGNTLFRWKKGILEQLAVEATTQGGEVRYGGRALPVSQVHGSINWTSTGLKGTGDMSLGDGGRLRGDISSALRPGFALPEQARFSASWENFDPSGLNPFLPAGVELGGRAIGSVEGRLLPGRQVASALDAKLEKGAIRWRTQQGIAAAAIDSAGLRAVLGGEGIKGDFDVQLGRHGYVRSSFSLPVPGKFPLRAFPDGPISVRLDGRMQEQGLLSAFFPGLVQETKGSVTINAQVLGTWAKPSLAGGAQLLDAAAFLPTAGIRIHSVRATVSFSGNDIHVKEFHAESGPGRIDGSGVVSLKDGQIEKYLGKLTGDRFQAVYLPDLRLLVSPSLSIEGVGKRVLVNGEIVVPQLLVYGPPTEDVVRSSPDVVVVGAKEKQRGKLSIELLAKVRVVLGDDVQIRMQGIDANLDGAVTLTMSGAEDISGVGEIRIVKGQYRTYGVELQVARGRVTFAGPLERARLDVLAVRKIKGVSPPTKTADRLIGAAATGAVKSTGVQPSTAMSSPAETQTVGVQISGEAQKPRVALYSSPSLSDADALSYMVLGRPVSSDASQASLLFSAAGTLLGKGEAGSIQDQVKKILGLETLEVGTETLTSQQGQVEQTMVRVGRYLAPNLYIGFGRSLFSNEYIITARYNITKRWEIQTRTGAQTGGDISYKVEFD